MDKRVLKQAGLMLAQLLLVVVGFLVAGPGGGLSILFFVILGVLFRQRANLLINEAAKRFNAGRFDEARKWFELAIRTSPKNAYAHSLYGFMMIKEGRMDKAIQLLDKAEVLAKAPEDVDSVRTNKAVLLWKRGKLPEAIALLEDVMKTYRTSGNYSTLGYFHVASGDAAKALAFNQEAYEFNSSNPVILDNLACSYAMSGDHDKAMEITRELMKLKPTFPDAYVNYAHLLEAEEDWDKAAYMYRNALQKRFWNTSTVTREGVLALLEHAEQKATEQSALQREQENTEEQEKTEEEEDNA